MQKKKNVWHCNGDKSYLFVKIQICKFKANDNIPSYLVYAGSSCKDF